MVRQQPFREIAREIERRIRQGVYPENSALPSRPELAEEFGVARATLDRAIQELTRSGILVSRHGSGTFAAPVAEKKFRVGVVSGAEFMEYAGSIFDAVFLNPAELENRSAWRRLFEFDGLLWVRPEAVLFPAIEAIAPQVPSVLINRVVADLPYVSSDHRRAYYEITRSRIAAYPEALPVLLQSRPDSLVTGYRCEGFVDACRETGKFYEVVRMPLDFKEKVATLEEHLKLSDERPLLVVSDTRAHTGALMRWSAFHPVEWRGNLFYSDFDNDFDTDIFGVRVTGFLQDQELLFKEAAAKLKRMLDGMPDAEPGLLVYPEFRDADT